MKPLYFEYDRQTKHIIIHLFELKISLTVEIKKKFIANTPYLFRLLDKLFPKNPGKIILNADKGVKDNLEAYYEYVKTNYPNKYRFIEIISKDMEIPFTNEYYSLHSFKGIYHCLTSKYIILTHAVKITEYFKSKRHIYINLWHGMPIKSLGLASQITSPAVRKRYAFYGENSHMFVTSDLFKHIMGNVFRAKYENIHITGQPRTDMIWDMKKSKEAKKMLNLDAFKKVIFYFPTYKECNIHIERQVSTGYENIFYMEDYSENSFCEMLEKNGILFIMKPHPYDEEFYKNNMGTLPHSKNFRILFSEDFSKNNLSIYNFLSFSDTIIADFSSITLDYLLLNRPVLYLDNLSDDYAANRGMILDDNYEFLMPGCKVKTYKELENQIINILQKNDECSDERNAVLPLLHKYTDNKSSERIYKIMKEL